MKLATRNLLPESNDFIPEGVPSITTCITAMGAYPIKGQGHKKLSFSFSRDGHFIAIVFFADKTSRRFTGVDSGMLTMICDTDNPVTELFTTANNTVVKAYAEKEEK